MVGARTSTGVPPAKSTRCVEPKSDAEFHFHFTAEFRSSGSVSMAEEKIPKKSLLNLFTYDDMLPFKRWDITEGIESQKVKRQQTWSERNR
jgi:hypothetical protein